MKVVQYGETDPWLADYNSEAVAGPGIKRETVFPDAPTAHWRSVVDGRVLISVLEADFKALVEKYGDLITESRQAKEIAAQLMLEQEKLQAVIVETTDANAELQTHATNLTVKSRAMEARIATLERQAVEAIEAEAPQAAEAIEAEAPQAAASEVKAPQRKR